MSTTEVKYNVSADTVSAQASMKKFQGSLGDTTKSITSFAEKNKAAFQKMAAIGAGISAGVIAVSKGFLQAYDVQAKAEAQVQQGLKTTANVAGKTFDELTKLASDLQSKTLFGDEVILKDATSQLLTFTNIAGKNFDRTQEAALDLATRLDGDLKSASIQLGKALNDPVANLSALSRSGIQFSEDQKATINALVETNQLAEAQTIILDELEKQYGGSAEAAALAGTGGFTQLKNSIGDIGENIGESLLPELNKLVISLKPVIEKIGNWIEENPKLTALIFKATIAIGGIIAVIGTLGLLIGPLTSGIAGLGVAISIATGPIGIMIIAGGLLIANWGKITDFLGKVVAGWVIIFKDIAGSITTTWNEWTTASSNKIEEWGDYIMGVFNTAKNWIAGIFESISGFIYGAIEGWKIIFENFVTSFYEKIDMIKQKFSDFKSGFLDIGDAIQSGIVSTFTSMTDFVSDKVDVLVAKAKKAKDAFLEVVSLGFADTNTYNGTSGKATGGPVTAGTPYMVGEQGPELFIPTQSGSIKTAPQSQGGGGVTINMGGVSVSNSEQIDEMAEKISDVLRRQLVNSKLGIA